MGFQLPFPQLVSLPDFSHQQYLKNHLPTLPSFHNFFCLQEFARNIFSCVPSGVFLILWRLQKRGRLTVTPKNLPSVTLENIQVMSLLCQFFSSVPPRKLRKLALIFLKKCPHLLRIPYFGCPVGSQDQWLVNGLYITCKWVIWRSYNPPTNS